MHSWTDGDHCIASIAAARELCTDLVISSALSSATRVRSFCPPCSRQFGPRQFPGARVPAHLSKQGSACVSTRLEPPEVMGLLARRIRLPHISGSDIE